MALLVEINPSKAVKFRDTDGVSWVVRPELVDLQADSETLYCSLKGAALDHFWDPYVESFTSPQYQIAKDYGGFIRLNFGQIVVSPKLFEGSWPPPKQCVILAKYTDSVEDLADVLFSGDMYLDQFDEFSIRYEINAPQFTQRALTIGPDYNGDTVPYPKALGAVTHVEPLRLADDLSSQPCYHLGGLASGSVGIRVISYSSASAGAATKVQTESAHSYLAASTVSLRGSVNFDGDHVISSPTSDAFIIPVAFPTDSSETMPIHAVVFQEGDLTVYDDGVPINENVAINGDGTFSLTASPVGKVTMSGTASETTLEDVIEWGRLRLGVESKIYDTARSPSPDVSKWVTKQMPIIDLMSEIAAFFTHYFYIEHQNLVLGDMLVDNGTETLTEHDYLKSGYSALNAVNQIHASWSTYEAVEDRVDEYRTAKYIKEVKNHVIESQYELTSGTADGTEAKKLICSTETFSTKGVKAKDVAYNVTDDTYTIIVSVMSETTVELEDDIFISGDEYIVGPAYPYGDDIVVTPYHDTKSNVITALQNILSILIKDYAEISRPLTGDLPTPGKKLTFPDTKLVVATSTSIRARNLTYNFNDDEMIISGEGDIS